MMPAVPTSIQIHTEDGVCPALVFGGAGPGVLLYHDGIGMRPAIHELGERLQSAGYRVVIPDLFYRIGPYTAPDAGRMFTDPAVRAEWSQRVAPTTNAANIMRDTPAYLDILGTGKLGVAGYCLGGAMALRAAALYPARIAAVAAYHPGLMITDAPDSVHLLVGTITASVYIGAAHNDPTFTAEQQRQFDDALTQAGVEHVLETYPALHSWVLSDTPVHDAAATERHWQTMLALFQRTLH
ncbi:MAG TPA: alpha/beta fold hydrolase [Kofleriaceae bacterium]|jgi:carboxymethylenebutenolidase